MVLYRQLGRKMTLGTYLLLQDKRIVFAHLTFIWLLSSGSNAFVLERRSFLSPLWTKAQHARNVPISTVDMGNALRAPSFSITTTVLAGMWSQDDEIQGTDRIKACVPYLLPLMDGDQFGQFIYERISILGALNEVTIGPLADLTRKVPFLSLGLFDVALLIPELISSGFQQDPLPRYIAEPCSNFVWYTYVAAVLYSVTSNLRGKKPDKIPFLSSSADQMVGPF